MRVAYVSADPAVPVFGSHTRSIHVQGLLAALRRAGADVHLFAAHLGGQPPPALHDLPVECLPCPSDDSSETERVSPAMNEALRGALLRRGPFDIVYERHAQGSFAAMEHARETGAAGLLEVNTQAVDERALAAASALLAVSRPLAEWLVGRGNRGRVQVVAKGVDPARFPARQQPSRPAVRGVFTIGFVGRLDSFRGLDVLAESFGLMCDLRPGFRLLVVGDGPGRGALQAALDARDLAHQVEMTGAVPPADVPALLASMDAGIAACSPQADPSFSPVEVYELMAAGLPVVAGRFPDLEETIADGVNGLLRAPADPAAFAAGLLDLADKPPLRIALGREARRTVLARHTWAHVADTLLELGRQNGVDPSDPSPRRESAGRCA
jgi:glycosyltransferase involved in cell wall biosynthesis